MATYDPFREFDRLASGLLDPRRGPRRMPMDLYRDGDHYVLNGTKRYITNAPVAGLFSVMARTGDGAPSRRERVSSGSRGNARARASCASSAWARASTPSTSRRRTTTAC